MHIVIVSGLSGSGKSVALHMLEDLGYYCIDNLPAALLKPFISHTVRSAEPTYERSAIGLDARNTASEIATVPRLIEELESSGIDCEVLYLVAGDGELLRRFAETRRTHPMSRRSPGLTEAIGTERRLLEPIAQAADMIIDTSKMSIHELRQVVRLRVEQRATAPLGITLESFGFKYGIPGDADFVFDARSLPNPYWEPALRALTGQDPAVIQYLESHSSVGRLIDDIETFLEARIPEYRASSRGYLTVAVGCTGGRHRSVYIVDRLLARFAGRYAYVAARHSSLAGETPIPTAP
ncbi:MAG: RNase adapter RapZ [Steroidobacteraceae bacterium]